MKILRGKRFLCAVLAALLCAGSAFGLAAGAAEATPGTPETALAEGATPESGRDGGESDETAAAPATAARLSLSVLDGEYSGIAANIDESRFATDAVTTSAPVGQPVALLLQADAPAAGGSVTVTLSGGAKFTDSHGVSSSGQQTSRVFDGQEAAAWAVFVRAASDFTATAVYRDDSGTITKRAAVALYDMPSLLADTVDEEVRYHITGVDKVGGEWLITFEGADDAYCMDHGLNGKPSDTVYWTYYGTTDLIANARAAGCATKLEIQRYVWEHRQEAANSGGDYVYTASAAGWQNVVTSYAPVDGPDEPEPAPTYDASWSVPAQSASGSLDLRYDLDLRKIGLDTGETIDGATFAITPSATGGGIEGGSWSLAPAVGQTITTGGHVMDDAYHTTGGSASVGWTLHYSVTKTSGGDGGTVGPFDSQEEADAAASAAQREAVERLKAEAQAAAAAAVAAAKAELAKMTFTVKETSVPYGFDACTGSEGSEQEITVPADGSATATVRNDEWSVGVDIAKIDSETHQPIAADAAFAVFEWDVVEGMYIPFGGYNRYTVVRNEDGSYSVANGSEYAAGDEEKSRTLYYTQRNEGRFLLVETQAPEGYYGDWTDVTQPGAAGQVEGNRGYAFAITKDNDGSVISLSNADYNADIGMADNGGTRLRTPEGNTVTVTLYEQPQEAGRTYATDPTGLAGNEDAYTSTPTAGKFQNDRVLGEIILTKSDLDRLEMVPMSEDEPDAANKPHGTASIEGAVYDLYAAEDIQHPDGVSGTVDYSRIVDANGNPIWHTTILTNGGWDTGYLPVLAKDHLVASAEIRNGVLAFANLYLGKYYLVERATGIVLPLDGDGQYYLSGQYPLLDKTLQPTGGYKKLATNRRGEYTDYVYKNKYSAVAEGRALEGVKTYDGYYLSFAKGYLCDETNHYSTLLYGDEAAYIAREVDNSKDAVLKSGFSIQKVVSTTGPGSPAPKLEGAGYTVYRVWELSKTDQFTRNPDGTYDVQSILDAYRKDAYANDTPKYDFSGEGAAVARMYESDQALVEAYNAALTEAYDFANGKGSGWVPTNLENEYRLSEIFTNEEGKIRVTGLPCGQYLVVETTVPQDVFQCDPFVVTVDSAAPQSVFCQPDGSVTEPSNSYMTYNVLNEELEGYLQLVKIDAETGKSVKIAGAAFQIYKIAEDGAETLLEMPDPDSGSAAAKTSTFYTDENGHLKTPEKLPLGRYQVVEVEGPAGFFNDERYNVVFELTSERVWEVVGNAADGMDDYILTEEYSNHETLGQLTIRKIGEVLTGYEGGQFQYEKVNLAGAVYEIRAHGDVATGDRQGTLWYADGDLVATVTSGAEGQVGEVKFAPTRTPATYDFLSVNHDGTAGEVTVTLPLGSYDITEVQPPYGFVLSDQTYTVTFGWNDQSNEVVLAQTIVDHTQNGDKVYNYDVVNLPNADGEDLGNLPGTIVFENARVVPVPETPEGAPDKIGIGIHKQDAETSQPLAGAVYELYTVDAIYSADGRKLADAGALLATSAPTDVTGFTWFDVDVPICGKAYAGGETEPADGAWDARHNSGNYLVVETVSPSGYLLDPTPMKVSFTYSGPQAAWQLVAATQTDQPLDKLYIHKTDLGGKELPGAELTVSTLDDKVVDRWVSEEKPHPLPLLAPDDEEQAGALRFSDADNEFVYILHENAAPDGYLVASDIQFKVERDEDGRITAYTRATDADGWQKTDAASVTMIDEAQPRPAPTPAPTETPAPTSTATALHIPQTGDSTPLLAIVLIMALAGASFAALVIARSRKNRLEEEPNPALEPRDEPEDSSE